MLHLVQLVGTSGSKGFLIKNSAGMQEKTIYSVSWNFFFLGGWWTLDILVVIYSVLKNLLKGSKGILIWMYSKLLIHVQEKLMFVCKGLV